MNWHKVIWTSLHVACNCRAFGMDEHNTASSDSKDLFYRVTKELISIDCTIDYKMSFTVSARRCWNRIPYNIKKINKPAQFGVKSYLWLWEFNACLCFGLAWWQCVCEVMDDCMKELSTNITYITFLFSKITNS